ncbi:putative Leucine-rich repeat family protein [Hibiscus syriacus]|uniref:Leucine-rich repeat family protein n=1 Tax=Hibiscus syriacus TaxID=106335 RepID=A0A6A3B3W7_HIBSY|nr:F-box protein At2g27310-like [Hibiscus syriacus]KAE8711456.1 putative Leucine-rich repeat family protein [Hibiscus syriacus]
MNTVNSTAVRQGGVASISAVHPDVFQFHILARLDGPSLASLACVSSQLHALSTEDHLWRNICSSTWPSVNHPRVHQIISTFPSGHHSFFSDSFPFPDSRPSKLDVNSSTLPTELIFAVDVYYQNEIIYSKLEEVDTSSSWYLCSPFRFDLLDPKDCASIAIKCSNGSEDDTWLKQKEENLSLSLIVIDPTRKRAVNMSSRRAVSVQRHWLTGDVHMRFGTVLSGDKRRGSAREWVECGVVVTCCGKEGGEMQVREVSMVMEDMEGKGLNGKDSLVILGGIIGEGRKKKERDGSEGKVKYKEFQERKRERKEEKQRKERLLDLVCITVGVAGFLTFWSAILFK